MFGYVKTDIPNMYVKDTVLYKASYCGLCKSIGRTCGETARFLLNYDLTFLSIFVHNVLNVDMKVNKEHCVIHHIKKRPVASSDEISDRIAVLNVILAKYKISDNVLDEKKDRLKSKLFNKAYKKAKKKEPEIDKTVGFWFQDLIKKEEQKLDSIDIVSDSFASMMQEIGKEIIGEKYTETLSKLFYNLGKWIYLIDALDDYDKDIKKNSYNVLYLAYRKESKEKLVKENGEISSLFGGILMEIAKLSKQVEYNFNHDLIDNILQRGLMTQTKNIMENCICKKTTKF